MKLEDWALSEVMITKNFLGILLSFLILNTFPLADNLQGVVFADWGNAWDFGESITFSDMKFGKGVGIRFDTFLGPTSIDYGFGEDGEGQSLFQYWSYLLRLRRRRGEETIP